MQRQISQALHSLLTAAGLQAEDESVHNEIQISMHICRSRMSDAAQGAFVVIPEISHSDISYIIKFVRKGLYLRAENGKIL